MEAIRKPECAFPWQQKAGRFPVRLCSFFDLEKPGSSRLLLESHAAATVIVSVRFRGFLLRKIGDDTLGGEKQSRDGSCIL